MNKINYRKYIIATLALMCIAVIGVSIQRPVSYEGVGARAGEIGEEGDKETGKQGDKETGRPEIEVSRGVEAAEAGPIGPVEVPEGCEAATLFFTSLPAKCFVDGKLVSVEPDIPAVFQDGQKFYIVPQDSGK